jgi:hypothetical protein
MRAPRKKRALDEMSLLEQLRDSHGYVIVDGLPKRDKTTVLVSCKGKQMRLRPGVVVKLAVPETSVLGKRVLMGRTKRRAA